MESCSSITSEKFLIQNQIAITLGPTEQLVTYGLCMIDHLMTKEGAHQII